MPKDAVLLPTSMFLCTTSQEAAVRQIDTANIKR